MVTFLEALHWFSVLFSIVMLLAGCAAAIAAVWMYRQAGREALGSVLILAGFAVMVLGGFLGKSSMFGVGASPPWPGLVDLLGYVMVGASVLAWPRWERPATDHVASYSAPDAFMRKAGMCAIAFAVATTAIAIYLYTLPVPPRFDAFAWRLELAPMIVIAATLAFVGARFLRAGRLGSRQ